jgi:hypothetical protein
MISILIIIIVIIIVIVIIIIITISIPTTGLRQPARLPLRYLGGGRRSGL